MSKKIRLWTIGNLEHKIIPTAREVADFREKLMEALSSDKDVEDIIWGPSVSVTCIEASDDILKILTHDDIK